MASPFDDGGRTHTMQIPAVRAPEPPRRRLALPWVTVVVLVAVILSIALIGVIALSS